MVATEEEVDIFDRDTIEEHHVVGPSVFEEIDAILEANVDKPTDLDVIEAAMVSDAAALRRLLSEPNCGLDRSTQCHASKLMLHWSRLNRMRKRLSSGCALDTPQKEIITHIKEANSRCGLLKA